MVRTPLFLVQAWMALVTAYLVLLGVASFLFRARKPTVDTKARRFAVLVPAHNEERSIGRLLDSLRAMDYDTDAYEVHVVATTAPTRRRRIVRNSGASRTNASIWPSAARATPCAGSCRTWT